MDQNSSAPNSTLKIDHYILSKTLGVGSSGKVKLARHEITGTLVAIKIINKKKMKHSKMSQKIKREIRLLRYFNHRNIIKLYEVLDSTSDIFMVEEYISKGELFDLINQRGKLPEQEARFFFNQIIEGVEYCHQHLVAHRDLKPENILIDEGNTVKIADFGLSNLMKDGKYLKTSCGSPNYAAPEVILGQSYCGTEVDTWSCGVILFALLAGFMPFDEEILSSLYKKIKEADFMIPNHFSPGAKDLVMRLLKADPTSRIKFYQIKYHPWLRENSFFELDLFSFNNIQSHHKINEEVFAHLLKLKIDFHQMSEEKMKEAIKKRKEYSFVIAYYLLQNDFSKGKLPLFVVNGSTLSIECNKNLKKKEDTPIFQNIRKLFQDALKSSPGYMHDYDNDSKLNERSSNTKEWIYGVLLPFPAKVIMKAIYEVLNQMNTVITIKSADYKIKCVHKCTSYPTVSPSTQLESDNFDEEGIRSIMSYNKDSKNGATPNKKMGKYSKNEIVFRIQIYSMPNKRDHCLDIQLSKGHPIKFLEFTSDFVGNLKLFLQEQKKLSLMINTCSTMSTAKSKSGSQVSVNGNYVASSFYDFQLKTNANANNVNFCKTVAAKYNVDM